MALKKQIKETKAAEVKATAETKEEVKTAVKEESAVTLAANEIAEGKVEIIEPEEMKEDDEEGEEE